MGKEVEEAEAAAAEAAAELAAAKESETVEDKDKLGDCPTHTEAEHKPSFKHRRHSSHYFGMVYKMCLQKEGQEEAPIDDTETHLSEMNKDRRHSDNPTIGAK